MKKKERETTEAMPYMCISSEFKAFISVYTAVICMPSTEREAGIIMLASLADIMGLGTLSFFM